ncbi:hypothetical protein CPB84DRAFT_1744354 [Gymnopilus junonius]|uniref:Uncharacterized protein n=1 Tax=Gymnopilus junonius TaxID=109634 RepID=A0A9P5TST6_GYMJU|nr:hypothetical protein CPB84DRAFT_1744354 [Gymnopilus junonius]
MVSTSSAAAQANENEKRRKQTMEKAKANHLSRQLQMRLQYARLKVEHGWQKQNLNEVENLYFHSSHLRGSKAIPAPTLATTQQQQSSFSTPQPSFSQSSISFRLGPSTLGKNTVNANVVDDQNPNLVSQEDLGSHPASPSIPTPDNTSSIPSIDSSGRFNPPDDTTAMAVDSQGRIPSGSTTNSVPVPHNGLPVDVNVVSVVSPTPAISLSPAEGSQSPVDLSLSTVNHYQSVKPSRPRTQKASSGSRAISSLTAKDMFNFGSSSTLTYDSFWSSHSGSTTPRPPPRPSGAADLGTNYYINGDYANTLQDLGRHNNNSTFTSLSSLPPQQ